MIKGEFEDIFLSCKYNLPAFNNLGACYEEGRGCEKNLNKAFEAYLIAAEKGDSYGWLSLSLDYKKDIFLSS